MKLHLKSLVSIILTLLLIISTVCIATSVTAVEGDTITYKYMISCDVAEGDKVVGFEGNVTYPSALSVKSMQMITSGDFCGENNGVIDFDGSNLGGYDFSGGAALITIEFNVNGEYNKSDIKTTVAEFYTQEMALRHISASNLDYFYQNVVDDVVISSGFVSLDNPGESYTDPTTAPATEAPTEEPTEAPTEAPTQAPTEEPTEAPTEASTTEPAVNNYTVIYYYNNGKEDTSLTRTYSSAEEKGAWDLAYTCMPNIKNPSYNYYINDAEFKDADTVEVQLDGEERDYTVTVNGEWYSNHHYLDIETIETEEEAGFIVNGKVVAVGTKFKFFVTGDMEIQTDPTKSKADEFASVFYNELSVSEENVMMELLATAKVDDDYERMGVAFATSEQDKDDIKAAVQEVTSGTARATNGIAVHNSAVGLANSSGQYQFIYAPYISTSKVTQDLNLYFYAYVVKSNGTIIVSDFEQITPYDIMN